ncbi:MAG: hypothetical protein GX489_00260 [Firmicutes bacterium]|nr:hypothetical protein [Bacillota bacterium]
MVSGGLSTSDKFFFIPIGIILLGSAVWNWLHGWFDLYSLIWFLIGANNLLLVGQRAWPYYRHRFAILIPITSMALILTSAYLLWTYVKAS